MPEQKQKINFILSQSIYNELRQISFEKKLSMAEYIRVAILKQLSTEVLPPKDK